MNIVVFLLLVIALLCFVAAAWSAPTGRLNLIGLGLALCTLATILGGSWPAFA